MKLSTMFNKKDKLYFFPKSIKQLISHDNGRILLVEQSTDKVVDQIHYNSLPDKDDNKDGIVVSSSIYDKMSKMKKNKDSDVVLSVENPDPTNAEEVGIVSLANSSTKGPMVSMETTGFYKFTNLDWSTEITYTDVNFTEFPKLPKSETHRSHLYGVWVFVDEYHTGHALIGTDGHRALVIEQPDKVRPKNSFLIPMEFIPYMKKMGNSIVVRTTEDNKYIQIDDGLGFTVTATGDHLSGIRPPDFRAIIPNGRTATIESDQTAEIHDLVKELKKGIVVLNPNTQTLDWCEDTEGTRFKADIISRAPMGQLQYKCGFDCAFLLDALNCNNHARFFFGENNKVSVVVQGDNVNKLVVLMPVRLAE